MSNDRDNTTLNIWVLQIYMSPITKNNYDKKIQKILKILLQNLYKIDVAINMICERQQPITCIFKLLFVIGDTSL